MKTCLWNYLMQLHSHPLQLAVIWSMLYKNRYKKKLSHIELFPGGGGGGGGGGSLSHISATTHLQIGP